MWRRTGGSSLCYACGKLNRVDAEACFYCGARRPGLWGFGPAIGKLIGRVDFAQVVPVVCVAAYLLSLLLDSGAALRPRGVFEFLAPSQSALYLLGMTGAVPWAYGRWWTLLTAMYLHGNLLHILFNLLWVRQLAPEVEACYGRTRLIVIFTAAGVLGFVVSNAAGVTWTVGASGAVFGLLGAMVRYGQSRGGVFGVAVLRQYGQWALVLFVMGFLMPAVNNLAHAGGFAGGYLAALLLGHAEHRPEPLLHRALAALAVAATAVAFAVSLWSAFA
jgi:rhomboid protease GluP